MKLNVGGMDKVIRIVLGVALLSLLVLLDGSIRWAGLIGIVPLLTGLVGYCPLYALLGISTCAPNTRHA
jgi:hypothetical protein